MRRLNVVVADADRDQLVRNTSQLSKMAGIDVVVSTMYGEEVIKAVYSSDIDVVVTDIVLKGIDGIGVLDAFRNMERPSPKKLILTRMSTAFVQDAVFERGASFFMTKPTTPKQLYERIRMLGGEEDKRSASTVAQRDVSDLLKKLGVSPDMKGFQYLEEAVRLRVKAKDAKWKLTERVYPAIASKFATTQESVERAIRTVIQSAWKNKAIQKYAIENDEAVLLNKKPTAGEMIDLLYKAVLDECTFVN